MNKTALLVCIFEEIADNDSMNDSPQKSGEVSTHNREARFAENMDKLGASFDEARNFVSALIAEGYYSWRAMEVVEDMLAAGRAVPSPDQLKAGAHAYVRKFHRADIVAQIEQQLKDKAK